MMGAGKTSIGRRLAARLGLPFVDADSEIEGAAGMTIPEIFAQHGEPYFRAGEARVIARLLGGGRRCWPPAAAPSWTRRPAPIRIKGISVWLKADLDVLLKRTKRRSDRPLAERIEGTDAAARAGLCRSPTLSCSRATSRTTSIVDEIIAALARHLDVAAGTKREQPS